MNTRIIISLFIALKTISLNAANYTCSGRDYDNYTIHRQEMSFTLKSDKKVTLKNHFDETLKLDRLTRPDEDEKDFAVFANYSFDAFGGFVKFSIPKYMLDGTFPENTFRAYYLESNYDEDGKVSVVDLRVNFSKK